VLFVDRPSWPGRGTVWCHLISDVAVAELHAFAELIGAPRRAYDRDHYDLSPDQFRIAAWLGARVVRSREITSRLSTAGLRRPKRRAAGPPRRPPAAP
jgi:Protein of unknown function (DUF4031)